jgi:hypothetical protein
LGCGPSVVEAAGRDAVAEDRAKEEVVVSTVPRAVVVVWIVAVVAFVVFEGQLMGLWHVLPDGAHACGSVLNRN